MLERKADWYERHGHQPIYGVFPGGAHGTAGGHAHRGADLIPAEGVGADAVFLMERACDVIAVEVRADQNGDDFHCVHFNSVLSEILRFPE